MKIVRYNSNGGNKSNGKNNNKIDSNEIVNFINKKLASNN